MNFVNYRSMDSPIIINVPCYCKMLTLRETEVREELYICYFIFMKVKTVKKKLIKKSSPQNSDLPNLLT